ncbi:hypothetical protein C9374_005965 [Naegleria lovaniensis]|uniref:RGS domain-containing protein n=1 Tax=Naegleria lovaniensis TaxID=51637 RepID=A0AA88GM04_NAELO|nr:uncharacterized protein C9374_005965 [Naegleria lovaniensis]KAG2381581.1 hypothetical protein C9374_005965 [Naegleria lovaniensis]
MSNNTNNILDQFPLSPFYQDSLAYPFSVFQKLSQNLTLNQTIPYSPIYLGGILTSRVELLDNTYISPVSWTLFGIFTVWFFVLLALVIWRRNYQPVKARDVFLMIVSLVATFFVSVMVTFRFSFGRYDFPCFFFTFLLILAYPGLFLPSILRCWRLLFVYLLSKHKQKFTSIVERRDSVFKKLIPLATVPNHDSNKQESSNNPVIAQSPSLGQVDSGTPLTPMSGSVTTPASITPLGLGNETPTSNVIEDDDEDKNTTIASEMDGIDDDDIIDLDDEKEAAHFDKKKVRRVLDIYSILGGKLVLSGIIIGVYAIHLIVFLILILTDLKYYNTHPFLHGCPTGARAYAVFALTAFYVIIAYIMLFTVTFLVKENWFIRIEVFIVMTFWLVDVLIFLIFGVVGTYSRYAEHSFPAGWVILFAIVFDNTCSCLIPVILSFYTSRFSWADPTQTGAGGGDDSLSHTEIREILSDKKARQLFKKFAIESFVPEGVLFWEDALAFKRIKGREKRKRFAQTIVEKYVKYGAKLELNLPNRSAWENEILHLLEGKSVPNNVFLKLEAHVERDMLDIFVRYKRTQEYKKSKNEIENKKKEAEAQKQMGMR